MNDTDRMFTIIGFIIIFIFIFIFLSPFADYSNNDNCCCQQEEIQS